MLYQLRATPYRLALDVAKNDERIDLLGHKVIVVGASSASALISLTLTGKDGQQVGPLPLQNLDYAEVPYLFDRIGVTSTAQAGAWIDLLVMTFAEPPLAFNYYRQQRGVIDSIATPISLASGTLIATTTGLTITSGVATVGTVAGIILNGNTGARQNTYYNKSTQTVWLGSVGVTVGNGLELPAGASYTGNSQATMYGICAAGTAEVRWLRESV